MHQTSSRVLLVVAAVALFLVPVAAIAAGGFTDVDDNSVFKSDIQWLANAGVTKGCNPPTNDRFCPESNVTREQMAAFMHRLAANKVVDAKTAVDADNLDGKDSTAFAASNHDHDADYLAIDGKADDTDLFDGKDSDTFMQHGTIITTMGPEGWLSHVNGPTSVQRYLGSTDVYGNGYVVHGIDAPASINGVEYGLASIEICLRFPDTGYLNRTYVSRTDSPASATTFILDDDTDQKTTGCYVYPVGKSLNKGGGIMLRFDGNGVVKIFGTTLTWTTDATD